MDKYINEVISRIDVDRKTKSRIVEDLSNRIDEGNDYDPFFDPYVNIGLPEEVASEFSDNLDIRYPELDIRYFYKVRYEYKSKKTIFGFPLIHINTGGTHNIKRAKGVIAIGDIATGVIAIGGISVGLVGIGGVGFGLVAIGGISLGVVSIGGIALGGIAIGAITIGVVKSIGALTVLKSLIT